ncbi:MAG: hypothetical protein WD058_09090 [Dehalococcoidia bacterium]
MPALSPAAAPAAVLLRRVVAAALVTLAFVASSTAPSTAAEVGMRFPAPAGTQWEVLAGFNTATHVDVDPYALDLWRVDGPTGGTPVLAPLSGTIGFVSDSCVSVRTSDVTVMMCHVFAQAGLERGDDVIVGQRLGAVAPDGQAGNNGTAHIHLQVNESGRRGYGSGESLPFIGALSLEGRTLPAITTFNGYAGTRFTSTNDPSLATARVDAGIDVSAGAGSTVSLRAIGQNVHEYHWMQTGGATVELDQSGTTAAFTAPDEIGAVLKFQVYASGPLGLAQDSVTVTVGAASTPTPTPTATPSPDTDDETRGRIVAGAVVPSGVGLVVFGGGTTEELVAASGCTSATASFWVTQGGRFVGYIPAAQVPLVNAAWDALYPEGLPANQPLAVRCQ